ncbi:hypothetical protein M089_5600 [Bacteroides ovatus str. 3725 D9 iii]|nr:hypothetical protein M089_5600 [Bacteroides ovatus str. 3725 D9 iii]
MHLFLIKEVTSIHNVHSGINIGVHIRIYKPIILPYMLLA